ncbi:hypothetical protein O0L34_g8186 [Tuta absoluta]|nr:hypothetical protein O0L34_g8186 [Tuta absoluta]
MIVTANSGPPIPFGGAEEDEDLGMLLTLLLLAAKNRCNNRCQCCPLRTIPVPYPVPFPVNLDDCEDDNYDYEDLADKDDETGNINTNEIGKNAAQEDKTTEREEGQKVIKKHEETDSVPEFPQKETNVLFKVA